MVPADVASRYLIGWAATASLMEVSVHMACVSLFCVQKRILTTQRERQRQQQQQPPEHHVCIVGLQHARLCCTNANTAVRLSGNDVFDKP